MKDTTQSTSRAVVARTSRLAAIPGINRLEPHTQLLLMAITAGVLGGIVAVLLNMGLHGAEGALHGWREHHTVWFVVLPAVGAALSSIFLNHVVREQPGHGVPDVIYAIGRRAGLMRLRSCFSRLASSFLTLASGGSAGPEAPVVFSGAAIGSNIGTALRTTDRARVSLLACGAAGALGAIFNAPLTGIVFAAEVILGEWAQVNIIPLAIASVAGTHVGRMVLGGSIPFEHQLFRPHLTDSVAAVLLALLAVAAAQMLMHSLWLTESWTQRLVRIRWLRAALGGLAVGLLGLWLPQVRGEGYDVVHTLIEGRFGPGIWLVAAIALAKVAATSLTLGSGGSGGIFAPSLLIGSATGVFFRRGAALLFPGLELAGEGCYALLGMAGLLSAALQAPLTGLFLVVEITGSWEVILPLMVVSAVASSTARRVHPSSVYTRELMRRGDLVRPRTDAHILGDIRLEEALERDCIRVTSTTPLRKLVGLIKRSRRNYFAVEDAESGAFVGLLHLDDIRPVLFDRHVYDIVLAANVMQTEVPRVAPTDSLSHCLALFDRSGYFSLPVVQGDRFLGLISKATLLDLYRRELIVETET